jgi:peptidoglycan biosynthesis protein MviN/MurJ (putative lipid II flippase)
MTDASMLDRAGLVSWLLPLIGVLMILGFATCICGILSCAILAFLGWWNPGSNGLFAVVGGLSLVLILVGPGAYSLDAWFFGLRRIEIVRRTPRSKR